ncbi:cobalt-precorrin 5A hydrolase [uncultured Ilyobacter sp.]|uniref:cobalt-precorrin 5A hydrolase n=1 Tax=uncultured Ilyobacter sp. TaxID=544433 RepID=UPI0029C744C3|nr:cobalt-precorrin 5A hydrolase [uncultured Ilyobacter sp.]
MKWAVISVTEKAVKKAMEVAKKIDCDIYTLPKYSVEGTIQLRDGFRKGVVKIFSEYKTLLFIMASGIVVRTIAPLIKSKDLDPGVLVMDEEGNFVTSLLSGHLGGANSACQRIADVIGAIPVISTASDVSGSTAVDTIAMSIKGKMDSLENAKHVTSLIVGGEKVNLKLPDNVTLSEENSAGVIVLSNRKKVKISQIIPQNIVVGIGCRRGTSKESIIEAVEKAMDKANLHVDSIRKFATVDLKGDEAGLLEAVKYYGRELTVIPREKIVPIEDNFEGSDFVKKSIGVKSVSAPCAILASESKGKFITEKMRHDGITLSIYEEEIRRDG